MERLSHTSARDHYFDRQRTPTPTPKASFQLDEWLTPVFSVHHQPPPHLHAKYKKRCRCADCVVWSRQFRVGGSEVHVIFVSDNPCGSGLYTGDPGPENQNGSLLRTGIYP